MPGMACWYPVTVTKVHSGVHWDFTDVLAKDAAFWPLEAANYQWCCSLLSPQCPEGTPWSIPGLEEDASPLPGHRSNTMYILVSHNVTQSPLWKKLLQCLPAVILSRASIPSFCGWPREHHWDSATFPNFSFPLGLGHPVSFLLQPTKQSKTSGSPALPVQQTSLVLFESQLWVIAEKGLIWVLVKSIFFKKQNKNKQTKKPLKSWSDWADF